MKIAFFGVRNYFSTSVLRYFIQSLPIELIVLPYVCPKPPPKVPHQLMLSPTDTSVHELDTLAKNADINILYQAEVSIQYVARYLSDQDFDIIIVACYPSLIPEIQLKATRHGAINIHPSLLPKYRGPAPIFWQLRHNEQATGVSLHCVSKHFDAGNIIAQQELTFPINANADDIDGLVAQTAATIVAEICKESDYLKKIISQAKPQFEQQSSYYSTPSAKDFTLSLNWSARHAYQFMRGTQRMQQPYPIIVANKDLLLTRAKSYSGKRNDNSVIFEGEDIININFKSGSLRAHFNNNNT